jgi:hypothetical protein
MVEKMTHPGARRPRARQMKERLICAIALLFCAAELAAESPTIIRAPVWVYVEPVPGQFSAGSVPAQKPPAQALDDLARFVVSGMLYGWNFSYTPSDKARNVEEYFSIEPIQTIEKNDPRFSVTDLAAEYPRLTCWAQFDVDETTARRLTYWDSILFRNARGRGEGDRTTEMEGVRQAYANALKTAIREYMRKQEKNKPKEIRGEIILRDSPILAASAGSFVADVKIIVNVREVIPYTTF